ncbi:hypothetical protein AHMF7605_22550 [Adhaeribacter arboris]|uniref:Uncharacterized protein n=1 Tax=Adhaeribacter arboris TaxID=2072846 RepID=A0A2T2YKP7_9BACT|nr:hypothetical protein [Adhaeribacter arboris]PSR56082.1 hypothetical protein AHMF7605_22550 [Adhaeribacter arboris]
MQKNLTKGSPEESFTVMVDFPAPTSLWQRLLVRLKLRRLQKKYVLRPLLVINVSRVCAKMSDLPEELTGGNITKALEHATWEHLDKIIYIVAVGLQNNGREPSKSLLKTIRDNFDLQDLLRILPLVLKQRNLPSLLEMIVMVKGPSILDNITKPTPEEVPAGEVLQLTLKEE